MILLQNGGMLTFGTARIRTTFLVARWLICGRSFTSAEPTGESGGGGGVSGSEVRLTTFATLQGANVAIRPALLKVKCCTAPAK